MFRREVLGLGGLAIVGLAGCSGRNSSGSRTISMQDDLRFHPESITVSPGTTVEWVNDGSLTHTVTAYGDRIPQGAPYFASGGFGSETAARDDLQGGLLAGGETYRHTFGVEGTHEYFCIPHEGSGMVGDIRVD